MRTPERQAVNPIVRETVRALVSRGPTLSPSAAAGETRPRAIRLLCSLAIAGAALGLALLADASLRTPPGDEITRASFDPRSADALLEDIEDALFAAHFLAVAEAAFGLQRRLDAQRSSRAVRRQRARAGVLAATALIALHRTDEARSALEGAIAAEPSIEADPLRTPPKLRRLLQEIRSVDDEVGRIEPLRREVSLARSLHIYTQK